MELIGLRVNMINVLLGGWGWVPHPPHWSSAYRATVYCIREEGDTAMMNGSGYVLAQDENKVNLIS